MYYFLAIFKENETDIKIITEEKVIDDPELIGYNTVESLKSDMVSTFGFEAIIHNDYEDLLVQLIK